MEITKLNTRAVSVPLENPVRTASGNITHAPLLLINLTTSTGVTGHTYLFCYTPFVLKPLKQLLDNLAPVVVGQQCAPQTLQASLQSRFRLLGNTGLVTIALAGIDMAAWDALARDRQVPLVTLLGGKIAPVPAYFSQGMDGKAKGIELARECLERGFTRMKIKAGYATLDEDMDVVSAVQKALGTSASLAIDFNQNLSVPEALRRCKQLDALGLAWIEEPTRHDDFEGHAKIAEQISTPIMIGENWFGHHEMQKSLAANASDLVMPDVMKIGGVTGWLRAAALADAARLPMSSHLFHEVTAHLMPITPTAHMLEYLNFADPVLKDPMRFENGNAVVKNEPGSGIEWDEAAVAKYLIA